MDKDSLDPEPVRPKGFERHEVDDYERKRYRGLDQRIVDRREKRLLRRAVGLMWVEASKAGSSQVKSRPYVLDAPCGYGRFSSLLEETGEPRGWRLVCSDLSYHMMRRAAERGGAVQPSLAVCADLKQGLPFKEGAFEAVFSIRFFHHLHRPEEREAVLREFSRAGCRWLVLSYYRSNRLHSLQRRLRRGIKRSRTQIRMIPPGKFRDETRAAGFRVVREFPLLRGIHAYRLVLLEKEMESIRSIESG